MFRTITAKYATACKRCGHPINVGDRMRYGGRGLTYHFKDDCGQAGTTSDRARHGGVTDDPFGIDRQYEIDCQDRTGA